MWDDVSLLNGREIKKYLSEKEATWLADNKHWRHHQLITFAFCLFARKKSPNGKRAISYLLMPRSLQSVSLFRLLMQTLSKRNLVSTLRDFLEVFWFSSVTVVSLTITNQQLLLMEQPIMVQLSKIISHLHVSDCMFNDGFV